MQSEQIEIDEVLYESFQDALFEMLSNWRNELSAGTLYHLMLHIWAENVHFYLNDCLTDYNCGVYHHRLLDFTKNFTAFKIEDTNAVYYFIHNVVDYLKGYLENIETEYNTSHKKKLRWEIAELMNLDYWVNSKKKEINFTTWGSVSFRENSYCKSYGQVFESLTKGKWNIKYKNKKIYPRFNYPESYSNDIFEELSGHLIDNEEIFEGEVFLPLFKQEARKKGVTDTDKIMEYFNLVKDEKDLQVELFVDFVDNYINWSDLFHDGLEMDDFYQCYLSTEEYQRLKELENRKMSGISSDELKKILDEMREISFKATQWTSFLRLNFCSLDRKSVPGVIFSDDYMKLL